LAQEKVPELIDFVKSPKDVDDDSEEGASLLLGVINDIILKTSKKSGKKYYKIILEDDEKQLYVTVFNTVDMTDLEIGDIIVIMANKDNYGFSKMRDYKIQKLN